MKENRRGFIQKMGIGILGLVGIASGLPVLKAEAKIMKLGVKPPDVPHTYFKGMTYKFKNLGNSVPINHWDVPVDLDAPYRMTVNEPVTEELILDAHYRMHEETYKKIADGGVATIIKETR